MSPLIRTGAGWHLLKVGRGQTEPVSPYAEVRDAISDQLFQEKFDAKRKEWLANLRAKVFIQILAQGPTLRADPKQP